MSEENVVPLKPPHQRRFQTLNIDGLGNINTEEGYNRAVEPIPKLLEQIADQLQGQPQAAGTINLNVKFPLSISCQWVICQFHQQFPNITLDIVDQNGKRTYLQGNQLPPQKR
ncbi:deaminase domain-containing protein [Thermoflavimicrobium daqui]|uniref:deaminase domain-containing protein n=1 Tax=Thermoflavimicrobium daqui TaxID=2137476 RepID=UPI00143D48C7|nr:deaminase domain-containing protein [Thermoflavimicrobium daqui]